MASSSTLLVPSSVHLVLLVLLAVAVSAATGYGGKVGGRTEVADVASNKEVQDLGYYSVEEYNRRLRAPGGGRLTFSRVVSAQTQVVAGVKYYLRVAAHDATGGRRTFDAVVVVKPWLKSRALLSFAPAAHLH